MNDTAIKNYCIWARNELIAGVEARMRLYGVAEGAEPAGATAVGGRALSPEETGWRDALLRAGAEEGFARLRDRAAYTWFNRIAAVRYMEVHDFLPSRVRMFTRPAADGSWELGSQAADEALDVEIEGADPVRVAELKQAGEDGPLFRYLFLAQCAELSGCLPGVFQPVDACMALLLPANLMDPDGVIGRMVGDIDEADWADVQVLGWMYQYYNSEVKDAFFASKAKETPDTIGPATQLFTPDWIVRYMVQNSLGRLWMLNNPASPLRGEMEYYIEPDSGHEDFIRIAGPEDISLCDPACGSGHILVYAFELLAKMYLERGYREREIPGLVLSKNLHGMEIDPRAAQIARLALAMCARGLDRRFFGRGVRADIAVLAPVALGEGDVPQGSALEKKKDLVDALAHLDEGFAARPGRGRPRRDPRGDRAHRRRRPVRQQLQREAPARPFRLRDPGPPPRLRGGQPALHGQLQLRPLHVQVGQEELPRRQERPVHVLHRARLQPGEGPRLRGHDHHAELDVPGQLREDALLAHRVQVDPVHAAPGPPRVRCHRRRGRQRHGRCCLQRPRGMRGRLRAPRRHQRQRGQAPEGPRGDQKPRLRLVLPPRRRDLQADPRRPHRLLGQRCVIGCVSCWYPTW